MPASLEQAVAFIKAGDTEKGKQLLVEVLKQNPSDENAWLWMTKCVTDPEQKRYCFEKVLKINSQNQHAVDGLRRLNNPVPPVLQPKVIQQQPVKKKRLSSLGIIVVIGLGFAFLIFCLLPLLSMALPGSKNTPAPTEDYSGGSTMAYIMCQKFVEDRLVAPATAKFPNKSDIETFTIRDKKDAFQIRGYVDSENRMGAFLRMYYVCEVSYEGNDKWHLDYIEFDE